MKKTILILSLAALLSACATTGSNIGAQLKCPPPLVVPKLSDGQDLALFEFNVSIYQVIVKRGELYESRIEMMCRIIQSTQQE